MGTFDPATFLDQTTTESGSTEYTPVPVGEYTAVAGEPEIRTGTSEQGKPWLALDIPWEIDDARVKELLQRPTVSVRQSVFVDMTESGGQDWGKGKNVPLGRLREALGLNKSGEAFNFRMITGRPAKVSVSHTAKGDQIYANVKGVAKLA